MKRALTILILTLGMCAPLYSNPAVIEFAGTKYKMAFAQIGKDGAITNEYVPIDETIDSWTTLLAVRHWPSAPSLRTVVARWLHMIQPLLVRPPESFGVGSPENGSDRITEAWLSAPDRAYIEINLHRFLREEGTSGIKAYQFAQKIVMKDGDGDVTLFMQKRDDLVAALSELALAARRPPESLMAEIKVLEQEVEELRKSYKDRYPPIRNKLRRVEELKRELKGEPERPNKSVQPTPGTVTPRAKQ